MRERSGGAARKEVGGDTLLLIQIKIPNGDEMKKT
jgi:hypothetical protein